MKKLLLIFLLGMMFIWLTSCGDDDSITVDGTIIQKYERSGAYFIKVEYEMSIDDGEPFMAEAEIKVSSRVFNRLNIGDPYQFTRPNPN